jgi:hypothetical protein
MWHFSDTLPISSHAVLDLVPKSLNILYAPNVMERQMRFSVTKRFSVTREQIKCTTLESAIATAVKTSDPSCEAFIGVFVERASPKSRAETNWTLKGIKFGKAEREPCNAALSVIIERLKREFEISD